MSCETDFTAINAKMTAFAKDAAASFLSAAAAHGGPADAVGDGSTARTVTGDHVPIAAVPWTGDGGDDHATVDDAAKFQVLKFGENVVPSRAIALVSVDGQESGDVSVGAYSHGGAIGSIVMLADGTVPDQTFLSNLACHVAGMNPSAIGGSTGVDAESTLLGATYLFNTDGETVAEAISRECGPEARVVAFVRLARGEDGVTVAANS